jgi:predicted small lipoprotein YifL
MKTMLMLILALGLTTALEGCGRRGAPEPPSLQQAG